MNPHRDLGNLGEHSFSKLCHEVGLIPNGSSIDKTGWDFIVEFPQAVSTDSLTLHQSPNECRIQVKSTDDNNRKIQIKLSNLYRLCTCLTPAFMLFLEFNGSNNPQSIFLVHLDELWITKVLKRVYLLKQKNPEVKLHKKTMTVHYSEADKLEAETGAALMKHIESYIESYIGEDYSAYVDGKTKHLKITGYEDGCGVVNFTAEGKDHIQALIDSHIGLPNKIPIKNCKGYMSRFGIQEASPIVDSEKGFIEIQPSQPEISGNVSFKIGQYGKKISLPCSIYLGAMNQVFPKKMQRFRVSCALMNILVTPHSGKCDVSFLFNEGTPLQLNDLKKVLDICALFSQANQKIHFEITVPNKPLFGFTFNSNLNQFNAPNDLLQTVEQARWIVQSLDVCDDVSVTIPQLLNGVGTIKTVYLMLKTQPNQLRVESHTTTQNYLEDGEYCAFVRAIGLRLGNKYFVFQYVLYGTVEQLADSHYRLHPNDRKIEFPICIDEAESFDESYVDETLEAIESNNPEVKFLVLRD